MTDYPLSKYGFTQITDEDFDNGPFIVVGTDDKLWENTQPTILWAHVQNWLRLNPVKSGDIFRHEFVVNYSSRFYFTDAEQATKFKHDLANMPREGWLFESIGCLGEALGDEEGFKISHCLKHTIEWGFEPDTMQLWYWTMDNLSGKMWYLTFEDSDGNDNDLLFFEKEEDFVLFKLAHCGTKA